MRIAQRDVIEPGYAVRPEPLRVLIADDNTHVRSGLRALMSTWPEVEVIGDAADGRHLLALVEEYRPTVVLMDAHMPVIDGLQATRAIKSYWPDVYVIIHSIEVVERRAALAAGADAFAVKGDPLEQLRQVLHTIRIDDYGVAV